MARKLQRSEEVLQLVGAHVRRLRKERHLSQETLSQTCGMFRTYLSRIENGIANPSITVLVDLSTALGVKLTDLFVEEVNKLKLGPKRGLLDRQLPQKRS